MSDASQSNSSQDTPELDLTPRVRPERSVGRKWMPRIMLGLLGLALIGVVSQTLGDASLSFKNVDAAVAERADLGEKRFLLQGTPVDRAIPVVLGEQPAVAFTVVFEGVEANVVHVGAPAETFQPSVPVVLEGRWTTDTGAIEGRTPSSDGWYFESSRMLVKHDNEYRVDNEERLGDAERGGMLADEY